MKNHYASLTIIFILSFFSGIAQTVTLTTSNLPIIIISSTGNDISTASTGTMKVVYNGVGQINNVAGPFNNYNGNIGIKLADFPDRNFQKLSIKIRLQTAGGAANPQSLASMPADEDWLLHAAYNDKTLMRDALAYKLANKMGLYAPKTKFVEVIIDGLYEGVYTLEETIKPSANRLNITAIQPSNTTGNALTGGYVLKLDFKNDDIGYFWNSNYANGCNPNAIDTLQIAYPKTANQQTVQNNYIQQYITNFENVLHNNNFDNVTGARKYADFNSFSNYFILSELEKNPDAYRTNTYCYKNVDSNAGKLKMASIGSHSFALGNAPSVACTSAEYTGWSYQDNLSCGVSWGLVMPFWWNKLMEDIEFVDDTRERWKTLNGTFLVADSLNVMIDDMVAELNVPQSRNFERWSSLMTINDNIFTTHGLNYAGEVSFLKEWLQNRIITINDQMSTLGHFIQPYSFSKLCGGLDGTLKGFSGTNLSYEWKKNNVTILSNPLDPQIATDGAGNYSLKITISGSDLCVISPPNRTIAVTPVGQNATGKSGNWEEDATWSCGNAPVVAERAIISVGHKIKLSSPVQIIGLDFKQNTELKYMNTRAKISF